MIPLIILCKGNRKETSLASQLATFLVNNQLGEIVNSIDVLEGKKGYRERKKIILNDCNNKCTENLLNHENFIYSIFVDLKEYKNYPVNDFNIFFQQTIWGEIKHFYNYNSLNLSL